MIGLTNRSYIMNHDEVLAVSRTPKTVGAGVDYQDGKPVETPPQVYAVAANVQPLTGNQLLLVPEGDRFNQQFMVYAQRPVAGFWAAIESGDRILREGVVYQVQEAKNWGNHVEARMVRVDVGPDPVQFP